MQGLAVTAIIVLALAVFGGPATYLLAGTRPRSQPIFWLHRIFVTLLGVGAILMGVTLMIAHLSIFVRALGALGAITAIVGLYRLFKGRKGSWR